MSNKSILPQMARFSVDAPLYYMTFVPVYNISDLILLYVTFYCTLLILTNNTSRTFILLIKHRYKYRVLLLLLQDYVITVAAVTDDCEQLLLIKLYLSCQHCSIPYSIFTNKIRLANLD